MMFLPSWMIPLNIIHVHGTMCCAVMHQHYHANHFVKIFGCYHAKNMDEANLLVIWGSLSQKLLEKLDSHVQDMLENRTLIHMKGCESRLADNLTLWPTPALPINTVFAGCHLTDSDYQFLVKEARRCLRA